MEATWSTDRLKSCRERAGLSMEHLGEWIGVHVNTIRQWEKGQSCPVPKRLRLLASALGTTVAYLSGENDIPDYVGVNNVFPSKLKGLPKFSVPNNDRETHIAMSGYGKTLVYECEGKHERVEIPTTKMRYALFVKLILSHRSNMMMNME